MTIGPTLFPHILSCTVSGNTAQLALRIPEDLAYLEGHFTTMPLVPGVVQLHWAILYGQDHFKFASTGEIPEISSASQLKFSHPIYPNDEVDLILTHHADKKYVAYKYVSQRDDGVEMTHSSGRFAYV